MRFPSTLKILFFTLIVGLYAPMIADAKPDSQSVEAALEQWKTAIEQADIKAIMATYDKDAHFISTFAQKPMTKRAEIEEYYKKVTANPEIEITVEDSNPRIFGDIAVNSGRYDLSYTQEGERVSTPARFTFIYKLKNGKWSIIEQHSSMVPLPDDKKKK